MKFTDAPIYLDGKCIGRLKDGSCSEGSFGIDYASGPDKSFAAQFSKRTDGSFKFETAIELTSESSELWDMVRSVAQEPTALVTWTAANLYVTGTVWAIDATLHGPAPAELDLSWPYVLTAAAFVGCTRCGAGRRYSNIDRAMKAFGRVWERHVCPRGASFANGRDDWQSALHK